MRKLALIVVIALAPSLGACGTTIQNLRNDLTIVSSTQLRPGDVLAAVKTFNALERLATRYERLPRCNGTNTVCRSPAISRKVEAATHKGRVARDDLIKFQRTHRGQLGSQGALDALTQSIATLQKIIADNAGALQ